MELSWNWLKSDKGHEKLMDFSSNEFDFQNAYPPPSPFLAYLVTFLDNYVMDLHNLSWINHGILLCSGYRNPVTDLRKVLRVFSHLFILAIAFTVYCCFHLLEIT